VSFLADGRLDSSFGTGGVVTVPSSEFGVVGLVDGRVIVASPNTGIRRLEADGSIDPGYGSHGVADTSALITIKGIALAADGRLLVDGALPGGGVAVMRLLADGRVDQTFGREGTVALQADQRDPVYLAVEADGRILVSHAPYQERLLPDGTRDPGFGNGGKLNLGNVQFAPQPDGRILVFLSGGWVVRLLADGSLDASFGSGGFVSAATGYSRAFAAAADRSVFVVGSAWYLGGGALLDHYLPDGTPDLRFGDFATGRKELYSASLHHGYRLLSRGALTSGPITISPDRQRIAYLSDRTGSEQLYIAGADGSHEQRITGSNPGDPSVIWSSGLAYLQPRIGWSPQGNRIAFTAAGSPCLTGTSCDPAGTWIVNADGSDPHQVSNGTAFLSWSPDGRQVLLLDVAAERVLVAGVEGGPTHVLSDVNSADAIWSPDGNEIALTLINDTGPRSIELVDPKERVIAKLGHATGLAWAPDGHKLAIRTAGNATGQNISLIRADGRLLTVFKGVGGYNPQWTPVGHIVYEDRTGVHIATANGRPLYTTRHVDLSWDTLLWTSPSTFIVASQSPPPGPHG
jgi:uncharacterized delta-60 repeat protein